ncbi:unnamed protein product [Strongylus vulgaris]|uniref:Uncharacterized protein n=1 Tax=Strongylus vulgaris TaxID=40348 RepID=A0A3P7J312_STRVU|nr:unnamed protein product [Strongylus vulgaris]
MDFRGNSIVCRRRLKGKEYAGIADVEWIFEVIRYYAVGGRASQSNGDLVRARNERLISCNRRDVDTSGAKCSQTTQTTILNASSTADSITTRTETWLCNRRIEISESFTAFLCHSTEITIEYAEITSQEVFPVDELSDGIEQLLLDGVSIAVNLAECRDECFNQMRCKV